MCQVFLGPRARGRAAARCSPGRRPSGPPWAGATARAPDGPSEYRRRFLQVRLLVASRACNASLPALRLCGELLRRNSNPIGPLEDARLPELDPETPLTINPHRVSLTINPTSLPSAVAVWSSISSSLLKPAASHSRDCALGIGQHPRLSWC
jgi:hypothetical protein